MNTYRKKQIEQRAKILRLCLKDIDAINKRLSKNCLYLKNFEKLSRVESDLASQLTEYRIEFHTLTGEFLD